MARKEIITCDICGKVIDTDEFDCTIYTTNKNIEALDMCPICYEKVHLYIHSLKEENNQK